MNYINLNEFSRISGLTPQALIYYRKKAGFPIPHNIAGKLVYVKEEAEAWSKPAAEKRGWRKGKKRK